MQAAVAVCHENIPKLAQGKAVFPKFFFFATSTPKLVLVCAFCCLYLLRVAESEKRSCTATAVKVI